jgi:5-methylcytosine-specific restriction endonuclease McrA
MKGIQKNRERARIRMAELRRERTAAGVCYSLCGNPKPPNRLRCDECAKKHNARTLARYYSVGRPSSNESFIKKWRKNARRMLVLQERGGRCADCGEDNPVVLDFDHVSGGDKIERVTRMYSLRRMREEADKCMVRCANCHRIKTWISNDTQGFGGRPRTKLGAETFSKLKEER